VEGGEGMGGGQIRVGGGGEGGCEEGSVWGDVVGGKGRW